MAHIVVDERASKQMRLFKSREEKEMDGIIQRLEMNMWNWKDNKNLQTGER